MILRFTISLFLFTIPQFFSMSHADDSVPANLVLIGKSMEESKSHSVLSLACARASDAYCEAKRVVEIRNGIAHWLSKPYLIADIEKFMAQVKNFYDKAELLDPQGWNWSMSSKQVSPTVYSGIEDAFLKSISSGNYTQVETDEEIIVRLELERVKIEKDRRARILREENRNEYLAALKSDQITVVQVPSYNDDIHFSTKTPEPNICRALGFRSGLLGSAQLVHESQESKTKYYSLGWTQWRPHKDLFVNEQGNPESAEYAEGEGETWILTVTCFGPKADTLIKRKRLTAVFHPVLHDMDTHDWLVQNSVMTPDLFCKHNGLGKGFSPGALAKEQGCGTHSSSALSASWSDGKLWLDGGTNFCGLKLYYEIMCIRNE